jgi:hypothetical protein
MSLNIIHQMRRNVRALETLASSRELTPERLRRILMSLDAQIESVEGYLEHAHVKDEDLEPRRAPRSAEAPSHGGDAA